MLFNSFDFGLFLVVVYGTYWLLGSKNRIAQNVLLLVASYLFYGLWDWRFLSLLVASSLVDYVAGRALASTNKASTRKVLVGCSIVWNLGVLIAFKYFNFFIESFNRMFSSEVLENSFTIWTVLIPLGLSFYTFQTMSYTIDVYNRKIPPTRNALNFLCFVSFFPQLIAGPIERAKSLLPQFEHRRKFDLASSKEGLRQILWGLFKKILVADKIGIAVTMVFANPETYGSITLVYGAVLFAFQVYCDFSAYSDIAIGTAKLFGFKLSRNFKIFYLSKTLTELWRGWHITLTRWFTDYVYLPILKRAKHRTVFLRSYALLLTMLLIGLWHGANWTFIAFGLCNGIVMVTERLPLFSNNKSLGWFIQKLPYVLSVLYTFAIYSVLCIFFRSENLTQALYILKRIFSFTPDVRLSSLIGIKLIHLAIMIIAEIATRHHEYPLQKLENVLPRPARWILYYLIIFFLIRYAEPKEAFIYFQF